MSASRRQFLAAIGTVTVGGLAGCSGVTDQSFAADPVVLPNAAQDELVLAETVREGETITRQGPAGIEVSITNQTSLYRRGPAWGTPTVLERFTSMVNGTEGAGSAVVATGSDVGLEGVRLGDFEEVPDVRGDQFSLVMPAGARSADGTIMHGKLMVLIPGTAIDDDSVTYDGEKAGEFFPGDKYFSGETYFPSDEYFPSERYSPQDPSDFRVFLPNAEEKGYRVPEAQEVSGLGVEQVDPGITIDPAETVFVSTLADFDNPHEVTKEAFDMGVPVSLGGSTFGLAALSTPTASVLGQSVNPVVNMETAELLQHDATQRMLALAGVTDTSKVEWLVGPKSVPWPSADYTPTLVGVEADFDLYTGVVSGEEGPWGVLLTVARGSKEGDHVIAGGAHRTPVSSPDAGYNHLEDHFSSPDAGYNHLEDHFSSPDAGYNHLENHPWFTRHAALTAATLERLERA